MKNKFLKGAHISERKVRELLKLFVEDLTATQIANISGISRITVNAYLKLIRTHIAKYCEERNPVHYNNGTFAFLPLQNPGSATQQQNSNLSKKSFYGIFKQNDIIYTDKLNIDSAWLYDWLKGKLEADQIRRSSRSVCTNLAEAYKRRRYKDYFVSKLNDAETENTETEVWLDFVKDCSYVDSVEYQELFTLNTEVGKLVWYMINNPTKFI